ncbi:MAG TPA: BON domain-containing protein [Polyangiaceae bacterium]|nr:BON domain-containing protein [Polyangiaceae bacterium]
MKRTDSEIRDAVLSELASDARVEGADIAVAVEDGIACLTGTVSSWGARLAAREAAYHVKGVVDVDSRLDVKVGDGWRSDVDIAAAVRNALDWDVFIPGTRIHTSVLDGDVTLRGEVKRCWERDAAEKAVHNIPGVRRVLNEIQVSPVATAPTDIRRSIEAALERRALREARRINLEIHEGHVILTGRVHSWAERQSVVGATKNTPGVRSVDDRLQIES